MPGAVFVDLDTELAAPPGEGGRHPLPAPAALQDVLRRAGVSRGSRVVAYDDDTGAVAARAWWLLRWAGLPADRVAVLDGGFRAWVAEGLPVTAAPTRPAPGDVVVHPGGMPVVDADGAAELARRGVLLDARAGARYRGEIEPVDARAGHVPGARNAPATEHLGADGRWLPPDAVAARYAALGVGGPDGGAAEPATGRDPPAGTHRPGRRRCRRVLRIRGQRHRRRPRPGVRGAPSLHAPRRAVRGVVVAVVRRPAPPRRDRQRAVTAPVGRRASGPSTGPRRVCHRLGSWP